MQNITHDDINKTKVLNSNENFFTNMLSPVSNDSINMSEISKKDYEIENNDNSLQVTLGMNKLLKSYENISNKILKNDKTFQSTAMFNKNENKLKKCE